MIIDPWYRQIERWIDLFSEDEPDLMGLELVREFDNSTKKFYSNLDDELNEWSDSTEIYVGIISESIREEVIITTSVESSYPNLRPAKSKRTGRKGGSVTVYAKRYTDETSGSRMQNESSEDVIVSDKNVKIVLQLPTNNKKENIKIVANSDYSIAISHLNYEGKRRTRTLEIPYDVDFETAKATYKNGILQVTIDRQ